ncbi:NAD(P)/FAD-dependent oxidoreductase [Micromonospora sp. WMMD1120]|uniref:bifunctional NAD(P)/FAD-dependent oxidoreductase/class I SAM-dependent methyltransferase n=1 Tax=Micromonospora sp. WMMD1120 TaxID=3016106 RepID=UPI0024178B87|nr:bifunctional NAD(P)/FAD-dependent oxidoreductase/class I SAM-dependent methyltransferase [Micromonospora sp. WMMD1120]MDG4810452.1 NAD(P)/FAD-dependent oxidoreductase [Micromonospora sp. WMMD1120]
MDETYDVVVVGGGAAGLSGALALSRARRSVLVVDSGEPRNAPADRVHNYLGREGTPPGDLLAAGRAEVAQYGGQLHTGRVNLAAREDEGFRLTLDGGESVRARRLLVTTGLTDELPDVPGLAQRWGRDVLHCPYCHGWEVRDRRIGVLATGPLAVHQAEMWRQWSPNVLLLLHDAPAPDEEAAERLAARGIAVVPGPVAAVEVTDDALTGVRLADGRVVALDAVVVATRLTARADLLVGLGLAPEEVTMGEHVIGAQIPADATGATAVPGVWVAGNVADLRGQVITSAAAGLNAAAAINGDLIAEDTRVAVRAYRQTIATMFEEPAWEERYRSRQSVWSGRPNPQLVAEVADLTPGRALDVGSGEGGDAVWLATRGWRVTAVDISATALERAAAHADDAGVRDRIEFTHADLRDKPPAEEAYDLVSAQFMHLPPAPRRELFARLAAAVAPGGVLLIVGHHPSDLWTSARRMHLPTMMYTADEVAADLDPTRWEVLAAEARPRTATDPDGGDITIHDAVLLARRR